MLVRKKQTEQRVAQKKLRERSFKARRAAQNIEAPIWLHQKMLVSNRELFDL